MQLVYSRSLQQTVKRDNPVSVTATSTFIDTFSEYQAVLSAGITDLAIESVRIETLRLPNQNMEYPILSTPQLQGIAAYFGSGKTLISALADEDPIIIDLILETVTGLIQAESFFYEERKLAANPRDYDRYWEKMYQGSCYYYSNLPQIRQTFMEQLQPKYRNNQLFCRQRLVTVFQLNSHSFQTNIHLIDSFHEMALVVETTGSNHVVSTISGNMVRCSDNICREALVKIHQLNGLSLVETPLKEIMKLTGSNDGCIHLGEMLVEGAKSLSRLNASKIIFSSCFSDI